MTVCSFRVAAGKDNGKEKKQPDLRLVEEEPPPVEEVVRISDDGDEEVLLVPVEKVEKVEDVERLESEVDPDDLRREKAEMGGVFDPESMVDDPEGGWRPEKRKMQVPHGWFVLIFAVLVIAAVVSAFWLQHSGEEKEVEVSVEAVKERLKIDEEEDREAAELIDRITAAVSEFTRSSSVDQLLKHSRDPERVRPLMMSWYGAEPPSIPDLARMNHMEPTGLPGQFWRVKYEDEKGERSSLLAEILDNGEIRVDWETAVCYQPMPWERFVSGRPVTEGLTFRVYFEPDVPPLYSHEFQDESKWRGYRLTARDDPGFMIGYVPRGSELEEQLEDLIRRNLGAKVAACLTLEIPPGMESPCGVLIDGLRSPNWVIINEP